MTIRRAILALGMVAALTFGAMALFGGQTTKTAEACCAGDPVLATENGMTIFAVGAPLAPVGGTLNFRIAITTANVPYGGYTWDVLTSNVGVAAFGAAHFLLGSGVNLPLLGLGAGPLCAAVGTNQLGAAPFIQLYGEGAGCASSVGATTTQLGDIATFSVICDEPGGIIVAEVDPAVPTASFPQSTLDSVGNNIPTELGPQQPNPLIPGGFIGGTTALCVQPGDLAMTKTASAPTNVVGGTGTYTLSVNETATRTFSGAGTAYVTFPAPGVIQDTGKTFPTTGTGMVGASVTISGGGAFSACTWTHVITSNTATQLVGGPYTIGGPAVPCLGLPDPFFAGPPFNGAPYKTTAVPVGTIANITDTAPAGVTFSGAVSGCVVAAGSVTCTNYPFAPGVNAVGTFTATYNTCGNKVNTATVAQPNPQIFIDTVPGNNSSSAAVNVDCPVLSVAKVATTAPPIFTSTNVTYTITVSNDAGGSAATGVVVSDLLGAGQTLVSATSGGSCVPVNTLPCTIASIPSPGSVVITVVVAMPAIPGQACDTASATAPLAVPTTASAPQVCVTLASPFPSLNGIAKDTGVDPQKIAGPLPGETLCDGIDNDGDGVIDDGCLVLNSFTIGNIFLCKQNLGGLPPTGIFTGAGQSDCGVFKIAEVGMTPADADTCNDDDDADGSPCAGDPRFAPAPWQWQNIGNIPSAPHSDYCLNKATDYIPGQTAVDCGRTNAGASVTWPGGYMQDTSATFTAANIGQLLCAAVADPRPCGLVTAVSGGGSQLVVAGLPALPAGTRYLLADQPGTLFNTGETSEGLGALEFQVKFDDKLFLSPTFDCTVAPNGAPTALGSTGRIVQAQVSIITENWVMFGCVSKNPQNPVVITPGADLSTGARILGTLTLRIQPDLFSRMRPAKDNGVSTNLLDENCEFADTLGQPMNQTLGTFGANFSPSGGLTNFCADAAITIRMLEGDINLDCQVDITDDQMIAFRYGQFFGQLNYNRFFDLEPNIAPDFDIDIKDLQTVFGRNGSRCSNPIPAQPPMTTIPDP